MKIFTTLLEEFDGRGKMLGFCAGMEMAIAVHMLWMGGLLLTDSRLQQADVMVALAWSGFGWRIGIVPLCAGLASLSGVVIMCLRKYRGRHCPLAESFFRASGAIVAVVVYTWCAFVFWLAYPRGWLFFMLMVTMIISSLRAAWLGGNRA